MRVTVIGAGNVGTHLFHALLQAGHDVDMVHGRGGEVHPGSDVYIISVKDDALAEVAGRVCTVAGDSLVVHTAGSVGLEVLTSSHRGVLYPMQTFSREKELDLRHVPLFLEGSDTRLEQLAGSISDNVRHLSSTDRQRLHLAAVFACNFVNHCVALADKQLRPLGLDWRVMLPLIDETVAKLHNMQPLDAQTGPAVRGDREVMSRHEAMIDDKKSLCIYKYMSDSIKSSGN